MIKKKYGLLIILSGLTILLGCSQATSPREAEDGLRRSFYQEGQIESEKTYLNSVLNGPTRVYYENGQIAWEGTYLNGKLDGPASFYYESGRIQAKRVYLDGIQTGQAQIFTPAGALMAIFSIENGRRHGEAVYFYQSGVPLKKENYANGVKEGPETLFSREGHIKAVKNYHKGLPVISPASVTKPDALPLAPAHKAADSMIPAPTTQKAVAKPRVKANLPTPEELLQAAARSSGEPAALPVSQPALPSEKEDSLSGKKTAE